MTSAPRIDPRFVPLVAPRFSRDVLDHHTGSVIGLWANGTLAYLNSAWSEFASGNGGQPKIDREWNLGANYFDAIPRVLRPFFDELFAGVPAHDASLHPRAHEYECSSAKLFRKLNMQIYALPERAGYVIVNSLIIEKPHDPLDREPLPASETAYRGPKGLVLQCSHCRRVLRQGAPPRWDWVMAWVERCPPDTSHGLCPICLDYYYGAPQAIAGD